MNDTLVSSWQNRLQASTDAFKKEFSALSTQNLNWKPNPETWSIGQIVDHLITTNQQYHPIFEQLLQGTYPTRFYERIPLLPMLFGKLILSSVQPDNKRKTPTVPVFEPATSEIPADILATFESEQAILSEYIDKLASKPLDQMIITSPASRVAVYSTNTAIDIIVSHEERHLLQAQRLLNILPSS